MWYQGKDKCPSKYNNWRESWKEKNPTYKYLFWDKNSISKLLIENYPNYYEKWTNIDKMIKKCDSARYFILHHYGGVYADLDTIAYNSMDSLIDHCGLEKFDIIFSEESDDPLAWKSEISRSIASERKFKKVIGNAILLSKRKIPFWIDFIDKSFEKKNNRVLESFSTWHLTEFYQSYKENFKTKVLAPVYLLNTTYIEGKTYTIHKYDATWFDHNISKPWEC